MPTKSDLKKIEWLGMCSNSKIYRLMPNIFAQLQSTITIRFSGFEPDGCSLQLQQRTLSWVAIHRHHLQKKYSLSAPIGGKCLLHSQNYRWQWSPLLPQMPQKGDTKLPFTCCFNQTQDEKRSMICRLLEAKDHSPLKISVWSSPDQHSGTGSHLSCSMKQQV